MININEHKEFVFDVANKNGRGTVSPARYNRYTERALMEWTMKQYGNQQEYQVGRPIPRIAWQNTQHSTDNLRHLLEVREQYLTSSGITIPDGVAVDATNQVMPEYLHFSSLRTVIIYQVGGSISTIERPVDIVNDDELGDRMISKIVAPSAQYPVGKFESDKILVYPSNAAQKVKLTYLRQPNKPVWGYNLVNNRPVYDSAQSTDIDAPKEAFNAIAMGVLNFMGVSLREQDLVAYAQSNKQGGI